MDPADAWAELFGDEPQRNRLPRPPPSPRPSRQREREKLPLSPGTGGEGWGEGGCEFGAAAEHGRQSDELKTPLHLQRAALLTGRYLRPRPCRAMSGETMRVSKTGVALLSAAIALAGIVAGCGDGEGYDPADVVLRGGKVVTMDGQRSIAQAVAVRNGRIAFVGSDADASQRIGAGTKAYRARWPHADAGLRRCAPGSSLAGGRALLLCDLAYVPLTTSSASSARGLPGRHARGRARHLARSGQLGPPVHRRTRCRPDPGAARRPGHHAADRGHVERLPFRAREFARIRIGRHRRGDARPGRRQVPATAAATPAASARMPPASSSRARSRPTARPTS